LAQRQEIEAAGRRVENLQDISIERMDNCVRISEAGRFEPARTESVRVEGKGMVLVSYD
jgi:hypothetical protein